MNSAQAISFNIRVAASSEYGLSSRRARLDEKRDDLWLDMDDVSCVLNLVYDGVNALGGLVLSKYSSLPVCSMRGQLLVVMARLELLCAA